MRQITIDEKWSMKLQDPLNGVREPYKAAIIYRHEEAIACRPSNLEVAMAQRILYLEDALQKEQGIANAEHITVQQVDELREAFQECKTLVMKIIGDT